MHRMRCEQNNIRNFRILQNGAAIRFNIFKAEFFRTVTGFTAGPGGDGLQNTARAALLHHRKEGSVCIVARTQNTDIGLSVTGIRLQLYF